MAFPEKVYVRDHRQLADQLDTAFPRAAFAGATLDRLFTGDRIDRLDDAVRERVLAFNRDLLDCDCEANPYCGHAEEKLCRWVLTARLEGLAPAGIVDAMGDRYHLYAYEADLVGYLDDAIRRLDALGDLAAVEGRPEAADRAAALRRGVEAGDQPSL